MTVGERIILAHFHNKPSSDTHRPTEYTILKEKHIFWACRVTSEIKESITGWKNPSKVSSFTCKIGSQAGLHSMLSPASSKALVLKATIVS